MSTSLSTSSAPVQDSSSSILYVPLIGTYISFSFDVRQTLDLHRCDIDEETEDAIRQFSVRKYVACVQAFREIPLPHRQYHRTDIRLLQQGLPDPIPELCYESEMCFPATPDTTHPLDRPPVKTSRPLPWTGCYHPSVLDPLIRLPKARFDYEDAICMDSKDWIKTRYYLQEDSERARTRRASASEGEVVTENESESAVRPISKIKRDEKGSPDLLAEFDSGPEDDEDDDAEFFEYSEEEELDEGVEHDAEAGFSDIFHVPVPGDVDNDEYFTPVVDYSPDLSGIAVLHGINQYLEDLDALESLVKKCREGPNIPTVHETTEDCTSEMQEATRTQDDQSHLPNVDPPSLSATQRLELH